MLIQIFIFSFFMLFLMSSSHFFFGLPRGRIDNRFHLYTFFTILCSGNRYKWSNQFKILNTQLHTISHLLALLGAHHILHISR